LLSAQTMQRGSVTIRSPRFATVCVQGEPETNLQARHSLLNLLNDVALEVNKRWETLDAVVFPGGFLHLDERIGPLCYADRVNVLDAAGFIASVKQAVAALDRSPDVLIVFGADGPSYPNGDGGDQLCVAADKNGIVGIGRKVFPVAGKEADSLLCYDADFAEAHRIVTLRSDRKAILSACYDMFGVAEHGDASGVRARYIRRIGSSEERIERGDRGFEDRLTRNLSAFRRLLDGVSVGIAAIHYFSGYSTGFWQRHGIAACSAALGSGFAVGAAHFRVLPREPNSSTLAAAQVPPIHLTQGLRRQARSSETLGDFTVDSGQRSALVRLFEP
jgi:hypothetical protein